MAIQQTFQPCVVLAIVAIGLAATSTFAELDVDTSLDFLPSDDIFVARGHSIRLDCDVDEFWRGASLPPPSDQTTLAMALASSLEAKWLLDGTPLAREDARYKIYKNGTLVVPKFGKRLNNNGSQGGSISMEGSYQCLAENQQFGTLLTKTINIRIAYLKEFLRQPEDLQAREGQPIIIPCSINSLPKAAVHWERDGVALPQDKKYVPLPSGSLLITNVHSSDVGSYRCKVVNSILKKTRKSKAGYLSMSSSQEESRDAPPTRILPLDIQSNITALSGTDVTFYCVVDGVFTSLQWLNSQDQLVSNNSIFTIRNITRQQSGQYTCLVSGSKYILKKVHFVNILQIPVFNSTPSSGVHALAHTIRLNCTAIGWPPPKMFWLKDGKLFDLQTRIRTKIFDWGLLISSPTVSDSGVYQCLAHNSAGATGTGASVRLIASTNGPREPRDIQCLPYKEDKVCLRWKEEANVQAYTILVHKIGAEVKDPKFVGDLLTNRSFKLVEKLDANAKYMFFLRSFRQKPSNEFSNTTCTTGVVGFRNFTAQLEGPTSMVLSWQHMSSDYNPCTEHENENYQLQWRRLSSESVNSMDVVGYKARILGLTPGETYEFTISPERKTTPDNTLQYSIPNTRDMKHLQREGNSLDTVFSNVTILSPPTQLDATVIAPNSINVSWNDNNDPNTVYTLCYVPQHELLSCEMNGKLIENVLGKNVVIDGLSSKTQYEIRIQAHFDELITPFSHSLLITTPSDVPSIVQGLEYKTLTRTSACVKWEPPSITNGRITKYSIRHTSNASMPVEQWKASSILIPMNSDGCWDTEHSDGIIMSTVLHDLDPDLSYYVNVVAVNEVGSGMDSCTIVINTKYPFHGGLEDQDYEEDNESKLNHDIYYRQGMGVALGIGIAFMCILSCFGVYAVVKFFFLPRRLRPNGGPYVSTITTARPKAINGQQCRNDAHELQQLVESNGHSHIPIMPDTILDSKGGEECPNGFNNIPNHNNKTGYLNGHATNLRITENPQFYKKADIKSIDEVSVLNGVEREYEEDSNSNIQKVCPITKALCYGRDVQLNGKSDANSTLNSTQTTVLLDDSISSTSSHRQPTLEPNG